MDYCGFFLLKVEWIVSNYDKSGSHICCNFFGLKIWWEIVYVLVHGFASGLDGEWLGIASLDTAIIVAIAKQREQGREVSGLARLSGRDVGERLVCGRC